MTDRCDKYEREVWQVWTVGLSGPKFGRVEFTVVVGFHGLSLSHPRARRRAFTYSSWNTWSKTNNQFSFCRKTKWSGGFSQLCYSELFGRVTSGSTARLMDDHTKYTHSNEYSSISDLICCIHMLSETRRPQLRNSWSFLRFCQNFRSILPQMPASASSWINPMVNCTRVLVIFPETDGCRLMCSIDLRTLLWHHTTTCWPEMWRK